MASLQEVEIIVSGKSPITYATYNRKDSLRCDSIEADTVHQTVFIRMGAATKTYRGFPFILTGLDMGDGADASAETVREAVK
jgi:hypothetical protein